jgi:hypothetical protein
LSGRVKITVIATGFDSIGYIRSAPATAPMQTPVDLHSYTTHSAPRQHTGDTTVITPPSAEALNPRLSIARRASLELPVSPPRMTSAAGAEFEPVSEADDSNMDSELDVPAFLRRSEG